MPTVAVTVAVWEVVRLTEALPDASVITDAADNVPAVVVNVTAAALNALPLTSTTFAVIVETPPAVGNIAGFAVASTRPTAAAPTAMRKLRSLAVPPPVEPLEPPVVPDPPVDDVEAPPELAEMIAIPLAPFARNVTVARPLESVLDSGGSMLPSVVVKITRVPLCGGVPAASSTCATIVAEPFAGSAVVADVKVIDDPVGARSGDFSQATAVNADSTTSSKPADWHRWRGFIEIPDT